MRLCRFGAIGFEKPAIVDDSGALRDLSGVVHDIEPATLSPASLTAISKLTPGKLPQVEGRPRIGAPFSGTRQFIAIGLNYSDHAREAGMPIPTEPVIFTKAVSCIQGPNDPVILPPNSKKTDWEVELGVVIGSRAAYVSETDALSYVAGYCIVNDVSEREFQLERGGTWDKGKGCPTFGPIGPWLVTPDSIGDPQCLSMWLDVNGQRCQTGSTATMVFGVAVLVSYVSRFITLLPGDIITTGTPPGVGMGMKPQPRFLQPGDCVTLGIDKLGEQRQVVVAHPT